MHSVAGPRTSLQASQLTCKDSVTLGMRLRKPSLRPQSFQSAKTLLADLLTSSQASSSACEIADQQLLFRDQVRLTCAAETGSFAMAAAGDMPPSPSPCSLKTEMLFSGCPNVRWVAFPVLSGT